MEKIEGIKILHVDGLFGGVPHPAGEGHASVADTIVNSALRYRAQAPLIDSLLKELGIEMGDLSPGLAGVLARSRGHEPGGELK
jgi:hypothetical protein